MENKFFFILGLTLILLLIYSCASASRSFGEKFEFTPQKTPLIEGTFAELWSQRTIVLKPVASERSGRGRAFAMDGPEQMGSGAKFDAFSFTAKATLMDSALIKAGFQQFAQLAAMQENEFQQFRDRYYTTHSLGDTLFIWLQLETTTSNKYLELDLWEFYLVTDAGKNKQPVRIEEYPMERKSVFHLPTNNSPLLVMPDVDIPEIGYAAKGLELYFVNKENKNKIKLVVRRRLNPNIQVEGSWNGSPND